MRIAKSLTTQLTHFGGSNKDIQSSKIPSPSIIKNKNNIYDMQLKQETL